MEQIYQLFLSKAPSYIPFLFILLVTAFVMYKAHTEKNSKFDIYDLLIDTNTRKADLEKIGVLIAILTLTLWFVDKAAQGLASVEEAVAYGGMLGLAKFARNWISAKYKQDIPATEQ